VNIVFRPPRVVSAAGDANGGLNCCQSSARSTWLVPVGLQTGRAIRAGVLLGAWVHPDWLDTDYRAAVRSACHDIEVVQILIDQKTSYERALVASQSKEPGHAGFGRRLGHLPRSRALPGRTRSANAPPGRWPGYGWTR